MSEAGVSNCSVAFMAAVDAVNILIRGEGASLIQGHTFSVARLIVAQLAHKHGFAPAAQTKGARKGKR